MSGPTVGARPVPTRSCVACRTVRPKRELVRVVRMPDGLVVVDETGRRPGRGAYLCRDDACLAVALAKGALSRALGVPVTPEVRAALEAHAVTRHVVTDTPATGGAASGAAAETTG